jgi:CheY-like chemotaxis protein
MKNKLQCILLIDDDEDDNYFHKMVIDEMNCAADIATVSSGFEALDFLKEENQKPPELLFLDINMPKMNGWEFLVEHSKLKESQKAKVIIVMLSSTKDHHDEKRAAAFHERIDFDYKPLTEEAMLQIMKKHFPPVDSEL